MDLEKMINEASTAAQKAHDECVPCPVNFQSCDTLDGGFDENKPFNTELEGNCGGAYIKVPGPGKNKISRALKKVGLIDGDTRLGYRIKINLDRKGSQSADRAEAAMNAASNVLEMHGLPNYVHTYLT